MKNSARSLIQGRVLALVALGVAILFFVYDIIADWLYEENYGTVHFLLEFIVFVGVSMALGRGSNRPPARHVIPVREPEAD